MLLETKPAYEEATYSTANNADARILERPVDIDPSSSSANIGEFLVTRNSNLVEAFHIDSDASFDAGCPSKGGMTTALYSKLTLGQTRHQDQRGYLNRVGWLEDTLWAN